MTPRENLINVLLRKGYTTVPTKFYLCPDLCRQFQEKTGSSEDYNDYFDMPSREIELPSLPDQQQIDWTKYYDIDLLDGVIFDDWGVAHEPGGAAAMHMTRMRHPMATFDSLEQMQAYPFPDFSTVDTAPLVAKVKDYHARDLAVFGAMECTIWETSWYLRDMSVLMVDMMSDDESATWLLDKVTEIACMRAAMFAKCGVDVLRIGDDVGMQQALMMSEDFYRQFLKSRLAQVIQAAKAVNPDIIIQYHSCGYVQPLIGDFIEAGIDVLNPFQPECMDFQEVHREYGDIVSFCGTIGTQSTMPFGSPEDVKKEVIKNLDIAGSKGGLLCCPTHLLEPEVPWDNIMAYLDACKEYESAGG